jgi:UDP:flavonoid glycosyltransferase YjiC (YdhE family)
VPGQKIASKSSLVIYHGGHETLMQVLLAGVPSLVIPVNPDQILVAKQIKKLGVGNYLKYPGSFPMEQDPLNKFTINEITDEIVRIINDGECKQKCRLLKKVMLDYINSKEYIKQITGN